MDVSAPQARTLALRPYRILDTLPEQEYDDITLLAAHICATPKAVLNFLPADRQWSKSRIGYPADEPTSVPLSESVCIFTVDDPDRVMEIRDLRADRRFAHHPGVIGAPFMRFYAGAPLVTPSGVPIGTLCVIDHVPRTLAPGQSAALQALARQVGAQLELRYTVVALRESERRFEVFMEHSPAVAFLKDAAGRYVYINQQFEQCFKRERAAVIGRQDAEVWPADIAEAIETIDARVRSGTATHTTKSTIVAADGRSHTWQVSVFPLTIGGQCWLGGVAADITAQQEYARSLELAHRRLQDTVQSLTQTSCTDALTQLPNRRALEDALDDATLAARDRQQDLAIIVLDVDHFKRYNDAYGHPAGDVVLRRVADLLKNGARGSDLVARYGGEEFVMLLADATLDQACEVAERCRTAIATAALPGGPVTISAGVAVGRGLGYDTRSVLAAADEALYQAKRTGRNRVATAGAVSPPISMLSVNPDSISG